MMVEAQPKVVHSQLDYEIRCIFCKSIHKGPYFDVIEEEIMRCRETAAEWQKGLLDNWEQPDVRPVSPETEARAGLDGVASGEYYV